MAGKESQSEDSEEDDEEASEDDNERDDEDDENPAGDSGEEEAMLPYTEHRKYPSKEIMENLKLRGRVALERYMAQLEHRRTGKRLVDEFNGTAEIPNKQNSSHKRNLSAYSDMPVQPEQRKPSVPGQVVARYAKCKNCQEDFDVIYNSSKALQLP